MSQSGRRLSFKNLLKAVGWIGLLCVLWGWVACSATPEGPKNVQHTPQKTSRPQAQKYQKYVGLQIPPMPEGHETELGYLLEADGQGKYAIEVVNHGNQKIVWMGRLLYHDKEGKAHWKIIAELPPRLLPEGFQFSSGNCVSRGRPQPEIVAIFKRENKEKFTTIHKAWKAVPQSAKFKELAPKDIHCINQGWKQL